MAKLLSIAPLLFYEITERDGRLMMKFRSLRLRHIKAANADHGKCNKTIIKLPEFFFERRDRS